MKRFDLDGWLFIAAMGAMLILIALSDACPKGDISAGIEFEFSVVSSASR